MVVLIRREFTVGIPVQRAWDHLALVEQWPSWARHIKRIDLQPPHSFGKQSVGVIHLTNGIKSSFHVTEYKPPRSWKWAGRFLWATVIYDHQFEALDSGHTRLIWIIEAEGFGERILGRLFASVYRRSLEKAIPLLIAEMNSEK